MLFRRANRPIFMLNKPNEIWTPLDCDTTITTTITNTRISVPWLSFCGKMDTKTIKHAFRLTFSHEIYIESICRNNSVCNRATTAAMASVHINHMRPNEWSTHTRKIRHRIQFAFVPGSIPYIYTIYAQIRPLPMRTIFKLNEMKIKTVHITIVHIVVRRHRRRRRRCVQYEYCRLINANECRWQWQENWLSLSARECKRALQWKQA